MNVAPKTLRQLSDVEAAGLTGAEQRAALEQVAAQYAVAITPAMAELIDRTDAADPIARQFVPGAAELVTTPEERADPIGDDAAMGPVIAFFLAALAIACGLLAVVAKPHWKSQKAPEGEATW